MIAPNKVITLHESVLGRLGVLMRQSHQPQDLVSLYHKVSPAFESIDQFILALDVLFVLGKIDVDPATRTITYAD